MPAQSLISPVEAEEVAENGQVASGRTMMMVFCGMVMVVILTLLIMLALSLGGAKTGLGTILPFLDKSQVQPLQGP